MPLCAYPVYNCRFDALPGHELCARHVRLDPNTSYQQCAYKITDPSLASSSAGSNAVAGHPADSFLTSRDHTYSCPNAVLPPNSHLSGEIFCSDHANELLTHYQGGIDDLLRSDGVNDVTSCLAKLKAIERIKGASGLPCWASASQTASTGALEQNALSTVQSVIDDCDADDCPTAACDVDINDLNVEDVWWGSDGGESDPESVDSETDDVLKYAGVYTAEEFVRLMREKLIRLQKLYIDQFQQLHCDLADEIRLLRQRSVVESMRRLAKSPDDELTAHEMIANGFVSGSGDPAKGSPVGASRRRISTWIDSYRRFVALNHYARPHGVEVILQQMLDDKRAKLTAASAAVATVSTSVDCQRQSVSTMPPASKSATTSSTSSTGVRGKASVDDRDDGDAVSAAVGSNNNNSDSAGSHHAGSNGGGGAVVPCIYSMSTHVRCGQPSLPLARHCLKHILSDSNQVLFRACGATERPEQQADGDSAVAAATAAATTDTQAADRAATDDQSDGASIETCPNPVVNFVNPKAQDKSGDGDATEQRPSSPVEPAGPVEINRCIYHTLLAESTPQLIAGTGL